ncbi:glycoside hydrolase family 3 C-terminal domain-containing protein [Paenarthrobacter sp. YAF11_1]|uniref:glycoside hydrolase family 3 C-terminal domain-containing protein n=1 Tax=Paenarthrobacter sp. YAF11_1 TaxID=3233074 RepID=UPI003F96163D
MDINAHFVAFLDTTVNLKQWKLDKLDGHVTAIVSALQKDTEVGPLYKEHIPQGSWAHATIIEPVGAFDQFDADFLLHLEEDEAWSEDPGEYLRKVRAAFKATSTYKDKVTKKNRCVRIEYAGDCHVDVVPHLTLSDGRQVIINYAENTFEETNPGGFSDWMQERDTLTGGNLRKVIRLMKYLRDYKNTFDCVSVILTTLLGGRVQAFNADSRYVGFNGVVVGDADGVVNLLDHGIAEDLPDALRQSFVAGLDVEMGGNVFTDDDGARLSPDDVPLVRVDDAVRRVLGLKLALGLFDDPYREAEHEVTTPSPASRQAALTTAEKGLVLLKNESVLPLGKAPKRVLLVGPYAESTDHLGAWVQSFAEPASSLADAIREECPEWSLTVREGTGFFGGQSRQIADSVVDVAEFDAVVVAVGEPSALTGEASSRSDLRLPGAQEELIRAVAATGKPTLVVMFNGRPLVTSSWIDDAPAVLEAWHSGLEGPRAVARALCGAVNPGGRLPMTFPRSSSQVPIYYDHENTGRPATVSGSLDGAAVDVGLMGPGNTDDHYTSKYKDLELGPQFPFGHGLSYTSFEYGKLRLSAPEASLSDLQRGSTVTVEICVENSGELGGDEVTMVFIRDLVASLAQPVRRLRAFTRTNLNPGETRTLSFKLGWNDLGFWDNEGLYVVEPGAFEIHVGGGLECTRVAKFSIVNE